MRPSLLSAGLLVGTTLADLLDADFDLAVERLLEALHVPGLSVGIVHNGRTETKGYGFSHLGPSVPATAETLYFTGSTTKAFTALAAASIVSNTSNDIKWSTPLSQLLPGDFVLSSFYATEHITLEDALSHRSGLPRHDAAYGWDNASATDLVRSMRYLPFSAEPRTKWQYNNMMFTAVGLWIEKFTGKPLGQVLEEWFWQPLGMRSTTFDIAEAAKLKDADGNERLARGYYWTGEYYVPDAYIDLLPVAGAGATISSVNDYTLWIKALLAASKDANSSSPVTNDLYRNVTTPRSIIDLDLPPQLHLIDVPTYALGWIIQKFGKYTVIQHSGGLLGFGTDLYLVPELDLGFVTIGNTAGTSNQVGVVLFTQIMSSLGALNEVEVEEAETVLHSRVDVTVGPRDPSTSEPARGRARGAPSGAPLPGEVSDYLGLYSHPAYDIINVSIGTSKPIPQQPLSMGQQPLTTSSLDSLILHITPSTRTWPQIYVLAHSHHSFFDVATMSVHGAEHLPSCSNATGSDNGTELQCKNEVAYELLDFLGGRAVFEVGPSGRVEEMGIEIEPELAKYAEDWREGMVWFEKF